MDLTGFSRTSFALLLQVLFPSPNPQTFRLPRLLDEKDKLGLHLFYFYSTMTLNQSNIPYGPFPMLRRSKFYDETKIHYAQDEYG